MYIVNRSQSVRYCVQPQASRRTLESSRTVLKTTPSHRSVSLYSECAPVGAVIRFSPLVDGNGIHSCPAPLLLNRVPADLHQGRNDRIDKVVKPGEAQGVSTLNSNNVIVFG